MPTAWARAGASRAVYGLVALAMVPLARFMRPLFLPPVVGVVICMGGMASAAVFRRASAGMKRANGSSMAPAR